MPAFTDSLRGYAFETMRRDDFRCRYCGLDGTASFDSWLAFSWDHLLPKGHPNRDNPKFIVAAYSFCNTKKQDTHNFFGQTVGVLFLTEFLSN